MATTPLTNVVPQSVRAKLYAIYVTLGVLIGGTQIAYQAIPDVAQPDWLTVVLAVYAYLAIPIGGLAVSNTNNATPPQDAADEPEAVL